MKRRTISLVLLALVAIGVVGCATSARQSRGAAVNRPRSFALAVTVHGALQPTPQQWATIQANFAKMLANRGWVLVTDLALADHILRVDFTPDPENPESSGHARVIGIRANPNTMVARRGTGPLPGAFGYSTGMSPGWQSSNLYSGSYYGYGDFYNYGYSNGWATVTTPVVTTPAPPPSHPPYRHPPGNREDCPPEHVLRPMPGYFPANASVASNPVNAVNDHPRPPPSDYRSSTSDRSHTSRADRSDRNDRSYSRNESTYHRQESYSNSSPDYSYSRSEPSYSSSSSMSSSASTASSAASSAAAASFSSAAASEPVIVVNKN